MKNTKGLQQYSRQRNEETAEKVNKAIMSLKRSKKKITIAAVARKADVSVATIYNNPALKEHITQLKELANVNVADREKAITVTKTQDINKIDELKNRNEDLREEIENLKVEKGLLLGQLKDLSSKNLELKAALEQYRKIESFK
jgi:hypothetical protein